MSLLFLIIQYFRYSEIYVRNYGEGNFEPNVAYYSKPATISTVQRPVNIYIYKFGMEQAKDPPFKEGGQGNEIMWDFL